MADVTRTINEPHVLPCTMTQEETEWQTKELLRVMAEIDDAEAEKKAMAARITGLVKSLNNQGNISRARLSSGLIMRSVECELFLNYSTLTAKVTRKDDGSVVQQRPLTDLERRMLESPELPFDGEQESPEFVELPSDEGEFKMEQPASDELLADLNKDLDPDEGAF